MYRTEMARGLAANNNNFYFNRNKALLVSVNFWYHFPEASVVNRFDAYYNLDLGLRAVLLKNKLSLSTSLNDVFNTSDSAYRTVVNNISQKYANLQLNRNFLFSLIFHFGKTV